jgi:poly-gamma-glutamate synthesis protein (capsule biosynthesis protein)
MVRIELSKESDTLRITKAGYFLTWVYTPVIDFRTRFYILPCSGFENNPGFFINETSFSQMKRFINDSRKLFREQNEGIGEYIFDGIKWMLNN